MKRILYLILKKDMIKKLSEKHGEQFIDDVMATFGIPTNLMNKSTTTMTPRFWFMRDDHIFIKLLGKDIMEVKEHALITAKHNPYGMVCPVIILENGKEIKRVGSHCHVDGNGNVDLTKWLNDVSKEDCVRYYDGTKVI